MKKFLGLILAGILAVSTCMVVFAAPPTEAPSEISVAQDNKAHSVYVFGTALALVSTEGSIEISSMGPVGRVDVMMDGVVIKNVASVDIPAGQRTRMALEEGSIIVKNVTAESGEAVKKQIEDAYASGAASVDLASLSGVTAYKVNEKGGIENAEGKAVPNNALEMSITSVDATVESFGEVMEEIIAEEKEREAAEAKSRAGAISSSNSSTSNAPISTPGAGSSATTEPSSDPSPSTDPEESKEPTTPTTNPPVENVDNLTE